MSGELVFRELLVSSFRINHFRRNAVPTHGFVIGVEAIDSILQERGTLS